MGLTSGWELVLSRWEPPCRRPHGAGLEEARNGRAHCPPSPGSPDPSGRTAACSVSLQTKAGPLPFRPWALSLDGALAFTGLQPGQPPPQGRCHHCDAEVGAEHGGGSGCPRSRARRSSKEPTLAQTDAAAQAAKQAALLAQLTGVGGEGSGLRPTGSPGSAGHTTAGLSRDPEACLAGCLNGLTPLLLIHPRAQHRGGLGPKDSPCGFPRANALRLRQSSAPRGPVPDAWQAGPSGAQLRHTVKQRSRHLGGKKRVSLCAGVPVAWPPSR